MNIKILRVIVIFLTPFSVIAQKIPDKLPASVTVQVLDDDGAPSSDEYIRVDASSYNIFGTTHKVEIKKPIKMGLFILKRKLMMAALVLM